MPKPFHSNRPKSTDFGPGFANAWRVAPLLVLIGALVLALVLVGLSDAAPGGSGPARVQAQDPPTATPTPTLTPAPTTLNCSAGAVTDATNIGLINDCVALLTAKDTLRGTASLNWDESTPIGNWNGITLSTATPQRVSRLDLRNRGLNGTIPPELGNLSALTRLSLQANSLSGSIPPELGSLSNLTSLSLWGNDLSGSIPSELGNLSNLSIGMSLRDNDLSGNIPPELGNLTNLRLLYLNNNDLSGSIPSSLGDLENLTTLYLWGNDLTGGIPPELGKLGELQYLSLSQNNLTGNIPSELGDLEELLELYLNQNDLSGSIPSELGDLAKLTRLYLWGNRLSGSIPASLGDLRNLRNLSLFRNDLSGSIPSELGGLARLRTLYLWGNRLSGSIPTSLGSLTNLEELSLSQNNLTGNIPSELGDLEELRFLHLNSNQLSGSIPAELGDLEDLEILTLERNSLSGSIPWAELQYTALQILYLNDNNLTGSIESFIGSIVDLQELRLDNNQLSGETPLDLGALEELTLLNISNNRLEGELSSWMPDLMDSLTTLVFHSNSGLCAPTDADFQTWLGGVDTVQGSSCAASDHAADRAVLATLYSATDGANWSKNTDWNGDELMRWWHGVATDGDGRVNGLFLSRNQLSGPIPPELGDLAELRYLYLDGNDLSGEIPRRLGRLADLRHLYLDENDLTGEIPRQLGDLPEITDLRLAGNQLTGCVPTELQDVTDDALELPPCISLGADSSATLEITETSVDNEFELVDSAEQTTVYISIPQGAVETGATLTVGIPDAPVPPADFTLPAVPRYVEINLERDDGDEPVLQEPVTVCLPRLQGVTGEQRVIHLGDGENARWRTLDEPGTYPDAYPRARFICGVATEFSIFTVVIRTPPSVLGTAGLILRIEPSIRSAMVSTGDRLRLSVEVYGRQNILDNGLADGVDFDWDDDADGNFSGNGREVIYTAPDSPGSYTVTVSFANASDCEANREGSKCSAEFEIRVRRPSAAPSPTPAPENPPGDIPTLLVDSEGGQYDVFTPVDGGTHDPGEGFSISAGPGVVPNGEIVGISMSRGAPASNVGQPHHRYTVAGDTYDIIAVDASGQPVSDYSLVSPAQACIPLPDALRANISDVAIAATDGSGSLTILASSVRITSDETMVCGNLSSLPASIAAATLGAPPDFPTPTPEPGAEIPDTGGSALGSSRAILWLLLVGIAAVAIGATFAGSRHRRPNT